MYQKEENYCLIYNHVKKKYTKSEALKLVNEGKRKRFYFCEHCKRFHVTNVSEKRFLSSQKYAKNVDNKETKVQHNKAKLYTKTKRKTKKKQKFLHEEMTQDDLFNFYK